MSDLVSMTTGDSFAQSTWREERKSSSVFISETMDDRVVASTLFYSEFKKYLYLLFTSLHRFIERNQWLRLRVRIIDLLDQ
jgi:hypothetical protein